MRVKMSGRNYLSKLYRHST